MTQLLEAPAARSTHRGAAVLGEAEKRAVLDPLWDNNPIAYQILGICSALAVTTRVDMALVMGMGVTLVTALGNAVISSMRRFIPSKIRIIVQLVVVSAIVIAFDMVLRTFAYDISKRLSVFVGLIITNCIVMGRLEAFAMSNPPWRSFLDGIGNGLGYAWVLLVVATVRELLGAGTVLGFQVVPESAYAAGYVDNGLMVLAPGAFLLLGIIVWIQRSISGYAES